nr:IS3 family transposase [Thalassobius vesicularis]
MVEPTNPDLSIGKQCKLLSISRSSFHYQPKGETAMNSMLMRQIDEQFLETPFFGVRQMTWPYLLRGLRVTRPNQVWAADITYLPMRRGFLYLVAIMDWHTRKVLAWWISNTLETDFCVDALYEAIHRFGPPEIMNTDQGSQFTSFAWADCLRRSGVRISMDGKGRFLDNIFVERLWRSLKYEVISEGWQIGG